MRVKEGGRGGHWSAHGGTVSPRRSSKNRGSERPLGRQGGLDAVGLAALDVAALPRLSRAHRTI